MMDSESQESAKNEMRESPTSALNWQREHDLPLVSVWTLNAQKDEESWTDWLKTEAAYI